MCLIAFPLAIATTNPELNRRLLLNNNGSKPTHPLPQPQQQQHRQQQQQQQQLYDSVPSGTYYSAVPLDGSYSNNSDHYSEVSFGGGTPHENPSNGVKHFKTAPLHSHSVQRGRNAIHPNGGRSMIYANEPLPRNATGGGGGGGLGEYEFDNQTAEAQAPYSWDSQKPLIPPPLPKVNQYSYAFVGRPEVCKNNWVVNCFSCHLICKVHISPSSIA